MNRIEQLPPDQQSLSGVSAHLDAPDARRPYVKPTLESLGGTLATLLSSGCAPCTVCPPDPGADQP